MCERSCGRSPLGAELTPPPTDRTEEHAVSDVFEAFRLNGRVAAVTGGASGIGEATGRVLAAAGASVVLADVNVEAAEKVAAEIVADGGAAVAQACDIRARADLDAVVDRAVSEYGRLDVMANVAGVASDGYLGDVSEAEVDRMISLNVKGTLFGCQAALRVMREQRSGSIINVSSGAIDLAKENYGVYAFTKAAVAMMTQTLAVEEGPNGIRVNAIAPGATITAFTSRHMYREDGSVDQAKVDGFIERMSAMSPLGLVGEPNDQAYLVLYLASDAARFSTGHIWRANGGQTIVW
jgi:3-oxoacyl-[acyl-carrier protein] reductase